jgi:hypothetical protein
VVDVGKLDVARGVVVASGVPAEAEMLDEGSEGRDAGGDDADGWFYYGPDCDVAGRKVRRVSSVVGTMMAYMDL